MIPDTHAERIGDCVITTSIVPLTSVPTASNLAESSFLLEGKKTVSVVIIILSSANDK